MATDPHVKPMYNANVQRVVGVQFGVMSPEEIRRRSVVEVVRRECYSGDNPIIGGLCDPRMGTLDSKTPCKTDMLDRRDSPGYFGHIELARPVFFVQFIKYVQELMQMICWHCGAVLLDEGTRRMLRRYVGYARFQKAYKTQKSRTSRRHGRIECPRCQMLQPKNYTKEELQIIARWDGGGGDPSQNRVLMTPEYIMSRFKRLTDEEIELFGFHPKHSRPEWLICTVLPVPPPTMRPSVHSDSNQRQEDDLTMKLGDIIKCNDMLKAKLAADKSGSGEEETESFTKMVESLRFLLQFHVATLIDNDCGVSPAQQRSGRPLKCIRQRLKSKEGRVRGNLMGKRVDFSSRSVITPDPMLRCDELGVPIDIATNLTVPERVSPFNIEELRACVRRGTVHPGAKVIERPNGQQRFLKYIADLHQVANALCVGDVVHRHMRDGDYVLFNRQPSLHKMSMMCHRVVVMKRGKTFRLNVDTTSPYNADFDGDEMNLHLSQSIEATNELKCLAAVPRQFIAPTAGSPVVVPVQDTMLAVHLLSGKDSLGDSGSSGRGVVYTAAELMNMSMGLSHAAQNRLYRNLIHPMRLSGGLDTKASVLAATTAAGDLAADFAAGGEVDGVTLVVGNRLLVKDQADATENGIYVVQEAGAPQRASDLASGSDANGAFAFVEQGTVNAGRGFVCTSGDGAAAAVGTDGIAFTQFRNRQAWDILGACLPRINIRSSTLRVKDGVIQRITQSEEDKTDAYASHAGEGGALTKKHFKDKTSGLVYVAFQEKGPYQASAMIDDVRGVATFHMLKRGFSVGVSDLIPSEDQCKQMKEAMQKSREERQENLRRMHDRDTRRDITHGLVEQQLMGSGRELRNKVQDIVTRLNKDQTCRYLDMVNAGSKGNKTNVLQMMGCLGQQDVDGKLIGYGFEHRTLPHFCKFDDSLESRGFVSRSFLEGLSPQEFFFHSMTGREGLIDTAVKTAQTGYIQRRIMKVLEDLSVQHDETVRNINGEIIQFRYGEDGFDATKIETQNIRFFDDGECPSASGIWERFAMKSASSSGATDAADADADADADAYNRFLFGATSKDAWYRELAKCSDLYSPHVVEMQRTGKPVVNYCYAMFRDMRFGDGTCNLKSGRITHPVNIERVIRNALVAGESDQSDQSDEGGEDINASYVVQKLNQLFERDIPGLTGGVTGRDQYDCTTYLFRALVHSYIGPQPALKLDMQKPLSADNMKEGAPGKTITRRVFDSIVDSIVRGYERAVTDAGEMVGVLAAQSVGEPATQMTLNTFHYAGVGEKSNVIRGVPRLNELLQLSKKQKAPVQYIQLQPSISGIVTKSGVGASTPAEQDDDADAQKFNHEKAKQDAFDRATTHKNLLEYLTLRDVTQSTSIYYDPRCHFRSAPEDHRRTGVQEDGGMLAFHQEFERQMYLEEHEDADADASPPPVHSPWVLRIEINRRAMLEKDVRMEDIVDRLHTVHDSQDICCVYADDNASMLMLRINLVLQSSGNGGEDGGDDIEDSMDDYYLLKMLEKSLLDDVPLRGIPNLKKIRVIGRDAEPPIVSQRFDETGALVSDRRYGLEAEGKNLLELLGCEFVDPEHTTSNDIHQIHEILGVEAAREAIKREIFEVINDAQAGSTDVRHIKLLADIMTHCSWGPSLLAIDRNGIKKTNIGPLAKCSFEETDKMLYQAAVFGDRDPVRGVSANIMLGQIAPVGTGTVDVMFDEEAYFRDREACDAEGASDGGAEPSVIDQWQKFYSQSFAAGQDSGGTTGGDDAPDDFFQFTRGLDDDLDGDEDDLDDDDDGREGGVADA